MLICCLLWLVTAAPLAHQLQPRAVFALRQNPLNQRSRQVFIAQIGTDCAPIARTADSLVLMSIYCAQVIPLSQHWISDLAIHAESAQIAQRDPSSAQPADPPGYTERADSECMERGVFTRRSMTNGHIVARVPLGSLIAQVVPANKHGTLSSESPVRLSSGSCVRLRPSSPQLIVWMYQGTHRVKDSLQQLPLALQLLQLLRTRADVTAAGSMSDGHQWGSYLDWLPRAECMQMPLLWNEQELDLLQHTSMLGHVQRQRKLLQRYLTVSKVRCCHTDCTPTA